MEEELTFRQLHNFLGRGKRSLPAKPLGAKAFPATGCGTRDSPMPSLENCWPAAGETLLTRKGTALLP